MDLLRNYLDWVFSRGVIEGVSGLVLSVLVAGVVLLLVGTAIVWTLVGVRYLFTGHLATDEELAQAKTERNARHEAEKAELTERLEAAKAARSARRQVGHRT